MAVATCGLEEMRRVQEMFTNCTKKYKAEYNMVVRNNKENVFSLTCELVDKIVVVCGDEWRQCHGEEEVRRMKEMQVEYLIVNNRGDDQVDIQQCDTVQQFRPHYTWYEDEDCSEEETRKSQEEFQSCTHSITYLVNDKITNLHSINNISSILCDALSNISSNCVQHLERCFEPEDVLIMSESHIEQLKVFFTNLAGDKVRDDLDLDDCDKTVDQLETINDNSNIVNEENKEPDQIKLLPKHEVLKVTVQAKIVNTPAVVEENKEVSIVSDKNTAEGTTDPRLASTSTSTSASMNIDSLLNIICFITFILFYS